MTRFNSIWIGLVAAACAPQTPNAGSMTATTGGIGSATQADDGSAGAQDGPGGPVRLDYGGGAGSGGDDGPTTDDCPDITLQIQPEGPTVMLLIDQSSSMESDFGDTSRWDALYDTLMNPTDGVVKPLQDTVRFGLTLYTSFNGFEDDAECPVLAEVPAALDNWQAMDDVYSSEPPADDTPTAESLVAVTAKVAADPDPRPKVIVLATDGRPDTCDDPDEHSFQPSIDAAAAAFAKGIKVFVLSVGDDVGDEHLQDVANAGAGLPVGGAMNAPFYKALDPQELAAALASILGSLPGCTFKLDGAVDLANACEGELLLDGMPLECGVDWTLTDPETVELLGAACEKIQDGFPHTLEVTFPCGVVVDIP